MWLFCGLMGREKVEFSRLQGLGSEPGSVRWTSGAYESPKILYQSL